MFLSLFLYFVLIPLWKWVLYSKSLVFFDGFFAFFASERNAKINGCEKKIFVKNEKILQWFFLFAGNPRYNWSWTFLMTTLKLFILHGGGNYETNSRKMMISSTLWIKKNMKGWCCVSGFTFFIWNLKFQ